ncbi:MAG: ABC transporter permease [Chloroflexi bacterium]|jgi:spermidine/putrescine transport system permease protein|nr:ABC transporter permease [Chloroflexota bacterium]
MNIRRRILVLMLPPTALLLGFFIIPMIAMGSFSFRAGSFGAQRNMFSLESYRNFFSNTAYQQLLIRSTLVALWTSLICVLLSYPVAYFLSFRAGERRSTLLTLLLVPAWTSFLLRVLAWKLVLGSEGLLSTFLMTIGVLAEPRPVLLYTRAAVIVTLVYSWIPFVALPIFAALERMDRSLLEAAADLGCPPWQAFLRVTLPLSLPGVVAGFFFVFIPTLGEWVTPALVGGVRGTMYGNIIQDQFRSALNWPMGAVMSLVMLLMMLVLLFIFGRFTHALPLEDV